MCCTRRSNAAEHKTDGSTASDGVSIQFRFGTDLFTMHSSQHPYSVLKHNSTIYLRMCQHLASNCRITAHLQSGRSRRKI